MTNVVGYGYNFVIVIIFRVLGCLTAPLMAFMSCDDPVWSQLLFYFGHSMLYTARADDVFNDVVADITDDVAVDVALLYDTWPN
jgi:hypothetical protein